VGHYDEALVCGMSSPLRIVADILNETFQHGELAFAEFATRRTQFSNVF